MANENKKDEEVKTAPPADYLSDTEKTDYNFVTKRISQLQEARKNIYGVNLESIWADADVDYVPHRLGGEGKRVLAQNDDEVSGWRGSSSFVKIGASNWQSDVSKPNIFLKTQTALAILIDKNPSGKFNPTAKKFQNTTMLMESLYNRSWEIAKSKQQLKLFVFNLAKYGWACGRTYPLKLENNGVVEYDDIYRENLDPWNCWIDDMAKPSNPMSVRDWAYRKVYSMDRARAEFEKYPNFKYVVAKGGIPEKISSASNKDKEFKEEELVEAYFYESKSKNLLMVILNDIPVVITELPVKDAAGNSKLSLWQTYWMLRHAESPYGIGIYEATRYDQALLDRIRNMTMDQLTLSIYKMFFHTGTGELTETGDIQIAPGVGKQVLDPNNLKWMDIPSPGAEAWKGIDVLQSDVNEASCITDPISGTVTGKTAYEIAQAREAALKKLKVPLENITDALEEDGYITVSLIDLLYSEPEIIEVTDPVKIERYLNEIKSDPELFERKANEAGEETFNAKVYREFPLNLEADEKGNITETKDTQFFRVKPKFLKWCGIIHIKGQSMLSPSKELTKALELEMYNVLIPLLANSPQLYSKIAKAIVKLYDKDPKDILPEEWLVDKKPEPPLIVPNEEAVMAEMEQAGIEPKSAPTPTPPAGQMPGAGAGPKETGMANKLMSRLSAPFRSTGK